MNINNTKFEVTVAREDGADVNLNAVYLADGRLVGIPFAKVKLNKKGNLAPKDLLEKINIVQKGLAFPELENKDLANLSLVYINKAIHDIEKMTDLDFEDEYSCSEPDAFNGELLIDFFAVDTYYYETEEIEFILLYDLVINDYGEIVGVNYYLTYLSPSNVERQLVRKVGLNEADDVEVDPSIMEVDKKFILEESEFIEGLSPIEKNVLTLRYGLDDGKYRGVKDVAKELGIVTTDDLLDIEAKAKRKIRCRAIREKYSAVSFIEKEGTSDVIK